MGTIALRVVAAGAVLLTASAAFSQAAAAGVLIMAHGGSAAWNQHVRELAAAVAKCAPAEVAFGMATRSTLQDAVKKLESAGVSEIVAVPLFVSSHSSIIEATKYLLGVRADPPPQLAIFAKMSHDHGAAAAADVAQGSEPVRTRAAIRMAGALDAHPVAGAILTSRAEEVSQDPQREVAILVAHGPEDDESNNKWLGDMGTLAESMAARRAFARVEFQTVRDDAAPEIRERAAKELRARVERATSEGRTAVIVPLLMSYGGIESGIRKRLDGLQYTMARKGLLPDDRLAGWIAESAGLSCRE